VWLTFNRKTEDTCWSLRSSTWQHYGTSDKLWYLTIEFYGKWQKVAIHHETPYLISQFHNFLKKSTITITPILQIWVIWTITIVK